MPCSELLLERGNRQDILVDQNQGGPEIPPMARRFRLALKVQSSNVRTDTDRAAGLMKDTRNIREARSSLPIYQPLLREKQMPVKTQLPLSHSTNASADTPCGP